MSRSLKEAQPLDLRLLPTALALWTAAFVGVGLTVPALRLSAAVLALLTLIGIACCLFIRGRRHRFRSIVVHTVLCAGLAGILLVSLGSAKDRWVQSGWSEAVGSEVPVEVTLRVTGDAQPLQTHGFDGAERVRLPVRVLSYRGPGKAHSTAVGAEAIAILPAAPDDSAEYRPAQNSQVPLEAGGRYRGLMQAAETDPADRVTAVLRPFGSEGNLRELEADRWSGGYGYLQWSASRHCTAVSAHPGSGPGPAAWSDPGRPLRPGPRAH